MALENPGCSQRVREQRAPFQKARVGGVFLYMAEKFAEPCLQLETGVCSPRSKSVCVESGWVCCYSLDDSKEGVYVSRERNTRSLVCLWEVPINEKTLRTFSLPTHPVCVIMLIPKAPICRETGYKNMCVGMCEYQQACRGQKQVVDLNTQAAVLPKCPGQLDTLLVL